MSQRLGGPVEMVDRRVGSEGEVGKRSLNSRVKGVMLWIGARGETI